MLMIAVIRPSRGVNTAVIVSRNTQSYWTHNIQCEQGMTGGRREVVTLGSDVADLSGGTSWLFETCSLDLWGTRE